MLRGRGSEDYAGVVQNVFGNSSEGSGKRSENDNDYIRQTQVTNVYPFIFLSSFIILTLQVHVFIFIAQ